MEDWFQENINKPYANSSVKDELSKKTNLEYQQISNWLLNRRKKLRKAKKNPSYNPKNKLIFFINKPIDQIIWK